MTHLLKWSSFRFFNQQPVVNLGSLDNPPVGAVESIATGQGHLYLAGQNGIVHKFTRRLERIKETIPVFSNSISYMAHAADKPILYVIGYNDEEKSVPLLRILNFKPKSLELPPIPLNKGNMTGSYVTSFCLENQLRYCMVGFSNGTILLVTGINGEKTGSNVYPFSTQKPVTEASNDTDTEGNSISPQLHPNAPTNMFLLRDSVLFITTLTTTRMYKIKVGKDSLPIFTPEGDPYIGGAEPNCISEFSNNQVVIADNSACHFYTNEQRISSKSLFPGSKKTICYYQNQLILVNNANIPQLTIFDIKNRIISFNASIPKLKWVFVHWNSLFVLTQDLRIIRIAPLEVYQKLEKLFQASLYNVAIDIGIDQKFDLQTMAEIYQHYGDFEFSNKKFNNAVDQYIKTIGHIAPSIIIQKFLNLDVQQLDCLVKYLEALYNQGVARQNHFMLLLNCYIKMATITNESNPDAKNLGVLNNFLIQSVDTSEPIRPLLDVPKAISFLKDAGFIDQVLFLAERNGNQKQFVQLEIEKKNFELIATYIKTLAFNDAVTIMKLLGKTLLSHQPQKYIEILVSLCTGWTPLSHSRFIHLGEPDTELHVVPVINPESAPAEDFFHLFVGLDSHFLTFLSTVMDSLDTVSKPICDTLIQLYLTVPSEEEQEEGETETESSSVPREQPVQQQSDNETVGGAADMLEALVGDDDSLVGGISGVNDENESFTPAFVQPLPQQTSFVSEPKTTKSLSKNHQKCLMLLKSTKSSYTMDWALVQCQMHKFVQGYLYLLEKQKNYTQIIEYLIKQQDHQALLQACREYGQQDPQLWVTAFYHISNPNSNPNLSEKEVSALLSTLDRENLMSPLFVTQTLSNHPKATLGMIKSYLSRYLEKEAAIIRSDKAHIEQLVQQASKHRESIKIHQTSAKVFQHSGCASCDQRLELPAIHFFCGCSYHPRCIADSAQHCPKCEPKYQQLLEQRYSLQKATSSSEQFRLDLQQSDDGFAAIAKYFGSGLFHDRSIVDAHPIPNSVLMKNHKSSISTATTSPTTMGSNSPIGGVLSSFNPSVSTASPIAVSSPRIPVDSPRQQQQQQPTKAVDVFSPPPVSQMNPPNSDDGFVSSFF